MAEKVTLFEANLNLDQAIKDAQDLKIKLNELKEAQKKVKDVNGETSAEYVKLTADIKATQSEYNTQINTINKVSSANNTQIGTLERLNAQNATLRQEQKGLNLETKEGLKRNKEINAQINKNTETIKKNSDQTVQNKLTIGNYASALGDSGVAINAATSAAKTFGTVLKVMLGPIGLIIAAIAALTSYFKRSEEGQNALTKVIAVFKVVLNNVLDVIGKVGEALFSAVQKPKEAWQGFKDFIQGVGEFFKNTFGNVIGGSIEVLVANFLKGFAGIGLAWQKLKGVFTDNTKGINEAQEKINALNERIEDGQKRVKEGAENLKDGIVSAYNKAKNSIIGFIDEQKNEIDIAKRLADQQAELDKTTRNNLVLEAKDRLKLSKLKNQIDDKEKVSAEDRIKLIDEENKILSDILQRNLDIAKQKYEIKKQQNALSASTKEDLDEEAQLLSEVYKVETQITSERKEAVAKRIEAEREIIAEKKKALQETINNLKLELDAYLNSNEARLLNDEEYNRTYLEKQQEFLKQKFDAGLLSEQEYNAAITEQKIGFEDAERERLAEKAQVEMEAYQAVTEGQIFQELEYQQKLLDEKYKNEIAYANKVGANTTNIEKKYNKAKRALAIAEMQARLTIASSLTNSIAQIFGEQTKIGKLAAAASATVSAIQGGVSALTGMIEAIPGPVGIALGAVAAIGVLASGYAEVKKIYAVSSGLPGDSGGGGGTVPTANINVPNVPSVSSTTVAPSVGAGIVSRSSTDASSQVSAGVSDAFNNIDLQPTLVTDDVTQNQNQNSNQNRTSTL